MTTAELPNRISYEKIREQLAAFEVKKNRLASQLNLANNKQKSIEKSARNRRTRTLIQTGGLVSLSGLMAICDIQEGDDLQNALNDTDKAATLLGILITCVENLRDELSQDHLDHFKEKGIRTLKMSPYYTR
ncbi:MAG: conjugal transfer protein TraD [Candidatus Paracaedibacteraceae bacterium]|nr:conjugal transfer protein TraD [Candidatus Paracaedibacteraceae bacterium]